MKTISFSTLLFSWCFFATLHASELSIKELPMAQMGHHVLEISDDKSIWLLPGFANETIFKDIYIHDTKG